ncbi:uncharacterized protein B0H64DRAFT_140327 [Chaetomium fimeti]|uniref:Uncharacterized protein n=1 Tax=Chaetomium fimeti TaxID=1854472 RepID=A0AAE0HEU3_9PEZI|nr:hypothetical protein B0H64DRAFT_140327 [Chaetomium fimeti]
MARSHHLEFRDKARAWRAIAASGSSLDLCNTTARIGQNPIRPSAKQAETRQAASDRLSSRSGISSRHDAACRKERVSLTQRSLIEFSELWGFLLNFILFILFFLFSFLPFLCTPVMPATPEGNLQRRSRDLMCSGTPLRQSSKPHGCASDTQAAAINLHPSHTADSLTLSRQLAPHGAAIGCRIGLLGC